jgi:hypothetical protein
MPKNTHKKRAQMYGCITDVPIHLRPKKEGRIIDAPDL